MLNISKICLDICYYEWPPPITHNLPNPTPPLHMYSIMAINNSVNCLIIMKELSGWKTMQKWLASYYAESVQLCTLAPAVLCTLGPLQFLTLAPVYLGTLAPVQFFLYTGTCTVFYTRTCTVFYTSCTVLYTSTCTVFYTST